MGCVCKICSREVECGELLCPICWGDYVDVYGCAGDHCQIDIKKLANHGVNLRMLAQRIRRIREAKIDGQ